jgi:hypothetical protein
MTTLRVSAEQRRIRLVERQLLGAPAGTVDEVTSALVALHATDPVTVYLSAWARNRCTAGDVDAALYERRSLVRMLGMRRTMFVVPAGLAGVVQAACTDDVARRMRRGLEKDLAASGVGGQDAGGWLRALEDGVLRALTAHGGGASGAQLSADEPRLRTELVYAPGKSYGGPAYITSRVLMLMSADGLILRGHRRGGWSSGQFEYFLPQAWLAGGDGEAGGPGTALDPGVARTELARRWLYVFGPAPRADLQWWAGWTAGQTKAALAALPVTEVDLDGQDGLALDGDLDFPAGAAPVAALLPGLDPTPMGWQARTWYLGEHTPLLFDRTGNVGPTVWWAGRVVGGWAQRASGEVVYRLLEDIGAGATAAVSAQAETLEAWLGDNRVTPRFRVHLERELSA